MNKLDMNGQCALAKLSLVNFPETPCAVIFFPGCSLSCGFCHNPGLVEKPFPDADLTINAALDYIQKRRNLIQGVVFSGGEPCLQSDLPRLAEKIHRLGLKIKLDTNGLHPERIVDVKADYIAMDLKTLPSRYTELGARFLDTENRLIESIRIVGNGTTPFEFRTTLVPDLTSPDVLDKLASLVPTGSQWYLQILSQEHCLDPAYRNLLPMEAALSRSCLDVLLKRGMKASFRNPSSP